MTVSGQTLSRMVLEHCQGEAATQVVSRPIESILVGQQPEQIVIEAFLSVGIGFEGLRCSKKSTGPGTELALSRLTTASGK
jgi:hypothetical protein